MASSMLYDLGTRSLMVTSILIHNGAYFKGTWARDVVFRWRKLMQLGCSSIALLFSLPLSRRQEQLAEPLEEQIHALFGYHVHNVSPTTNRGIAAGLRLPLEQVNPAGPTFQSNTRQGVSE